jgi:DNA-directed RNA polymerase subunit RPC12/RpoP
MYECPWCGRKSFSFWQKQSLGPSRSIACGHCARRVSVPWGRAHLAAIPVFAGALVGLWFLGDAFNSKVVALAGGFIGLAVGMVLTMPLYHRFVPLVKPARP